MKKGIYFILFLLVLTSCSQDIVFNNNAAFQGVKDNIFWKADDAMASIGTSNSLNIKAVTINETVILKIALPSSLVNQKDPSTYLTYVLGNSETRKASYSRTLNTISTSYQTGFGIGDGQIVITDYDGTSISGNFRFNAKNTNSSSLEATNVNFQNGFFYKVPITP